MSQGFIDANSANDSGMTSALKASGSGAHLRLWATASTPDDGFPSDHSSAARTSRGPLRQSMKTYSAPPHPESAASRSVSGPVSM